MRVCIAQYGGNGGTEHVGAAMAHTVTCGGGAGLFLRVRDCELLLLAAPARGAKLPAPYLDSYGETDQVLLSTSTLPLFISIRYCLCIILILPLVFFSTLIVCQLSYTHSLLSCSFYLILVPADEPA